MMAVVWGAALAGMAVKLLLPGRFDRLAIAFYLAIGWSGAVVLRPLVGTLPPLTLGLIIAGGIVYSCGVLVFVLKDMRFQSAVWHGFVVAGAGAASRGGHGLPGGRPALRPKSVAAGGSASSDFQFRHISA